MFFHLPSSDHVIVRTLQLGLGDYGLHWLGRGVVSREWTSWGRHGVFINLRLLRRLVFRHCGMLRGVAP